MIMDKCGNVFDPARMEHPAKFVDLKVGRSAHPSGIVRRAVSC
jgi:hypothetical protein